MPLNLELVKLALARQKRAFVPSGGAPAPGGAPPMDPSMMGGAPPMDPSMMGGAPPMDPSMMGGAPPMDPSMMGGAPPAMPPMDPSMMGGAADASGGAGGGGGGGGDIRGIIRDELAAAGLTGGGTTPAGKKAPKADINTIATDVFQLKKMFLHFLRMQGIDLPPDILDGPNRDPVTGAPAVSPSGGSDVTPGSSQSQPQSSIPPIEPIQGAFPSGGGGGAEKASAEIDELLREPSTNGVGRPIRHDDQVTGQKVRSKAAALALMFRQRRQG